MSLEVRAEIGHLAARVVVVEAEAVQAAVLVIGGRRGWAEPCLVVEAFRHGHRLPTGAGAHLVVITDEGRDLLDLADAAVADQLAGEAGDRIGPLVAARLQHPVVPANGLHHLLTLGDGKRQRLLTVDVLAGLGRGDGHQGVPVVGHRDDHGVDVGAGQQIAEVDQRVATLIAGRLLLPGVAILDQLPGRLAPAELLLVIVAVAAAVDVADGHHLRLGPAEELA